jgi:hypothetical protein
MTAALHIGLQVQHAHQKLKKNKGSTFLVFDEHQQHADELAELLFEPPEWTDGYYRRKPSQARLDQVIDSAFYARSHHVGLVQIADLFAFLFRRYAELMDYGEPEDFSGETEVMTAWITQVSARLLPIAYRWPKVSREPTTSWYKDAAPASLIALG